MKPGPVRTVALAALAALLALFPPACAGGDGEAISEIALSDVMLQDSFALYYPVAFSTAASVSDYVVSPDLSNVAGAGRADMPPEARRVLGLQGFVVVAGESETIYGAYQDIEGAKFVTTEALLEAYLSICAYALRAVEELSLVGALGDMVGALCYVVEDMYRGGGAAAREAAAAVLVYLGVAARLLGVEAPVPPDGEGMVEEEYALITGHAGTALSPFSGYSEDYTRYEPLGHYADGGQLEGYFKAMTWLGEVGFHLRPAAGSGGVALGREAARQAMLLVAALHMAEVGGEPAYAVWDRLYQSSSFLAGFAGELDAYTCTRLMRELLGGRFPLSDLEDDAVIDGFIDRVVAEGPTGSAQAAAGHAGVDEPAAFRLFGRRDTVDGFILRQLASPEVPERLLPRGLDVPSALGSERALDILYQVYEEDEVAGYAEKMGELRELYQAADPARARSSAYWSCLDIMRLLLRQYGEGYPLFMRGEAWQDRCLYAFLGSLVRMHRDDAIQPVAGVEEGPVAPGGAAVVRGYVDPQPEAFARLAAVTDMTRRGLEERVLAQPHVLERLDDLHELLLALKAMAEKELRGEALSDEEYAVIDGIGHTLQRLVTFPAGVAEDAAWEMSVPLPFVNDAYTSGEYGEVLQVGVGKPVIYYVIVPIEGRPVLTAGAGNSYHEFVKPAGGRFDDREWREAVEAGEMPETPAWTESFLR